MTIEDQPRETVDRRFELVCPWCVEAFGITLDMSDGEVHCPHCERAVTVPSRADLEAMFASPAPPPQLGDAPPIVGPPRVLSELIAPPTVAPISLSDPLKPPPLPPVTTDALEPPANPQKKERAAVPPVAENAKPVTTPDKPVAKVVTLATESGEVVSFRARGKVIQTSRGEVELRDRSRGERSRRRGLFSGIFAVLFLAILIGVPAWLLNRSSPLPRPQSENEAAKESAEPKSDPQEVKDADAIPGVGIK